MYRFGAYELDTEAGELRKGASPVALQPKPLQLLQLLIEARDRIVPLDELFEALWPDTVVTPSSLTRAVSHARRAIGDTHKGDAIKSHARRGYRFCADVIDVTQGSPSEAATVGSRATAREVPPFVGRESVLEELRACLGGARASEGRIAVVEGRPGVGKTRLAEVFAAEAEGRGALVLRAQARDGEGVPAFWLWTQLLRQMAAEDSLGEEGAELATRSAELGVHAPAGEDSHPHLSKEQSRFLFFDAVSRALTALARERPTLLLLEDLHWAGPASLQLLEHLVHELSGVPLCVVATIREEPRADRDPLVRLLGALRRLDRCVPVKLGGFSRAEVGELLRRVLGRPPEVELTSELFARTEGVPLYLREAMRLLEQRGAFDQEDPVQAGSVALPAESLGLIASGFDGLSDGAAGLVGAASVLGRDFGLAALAETANVERPDALDLLDEAIAAGLVEEDPDATAAFRFTHALFQDAAYDRLATGRRARLHLRAAERLERRHADDPDAVIDELAFHHHRAIAVGDAEKAWACAIRAGECSTRKLAWEQAARHYELAAEALLHFELEEGTGTLATDRKLQTWLCLGDARLASGDREGRQQILARAMDLARTYGRAQAFAEAAILYCDTSEWAVPDAKAEAFVDEALAGLGPEPTAVRARLLTRQVYRYILRDREAGEPLARDAVELARQTGDGVAIQEALYVLLFLIAGPDDHEERIRLGDEMVGAAADSELEAETVIATIDVASDALERGDLALAQRWREQAGRLCGGAPPPIMGWHVAVYDTGVALMQGQFDGLVDQADRALSVGRRVQHPFASGCHNAQVTMLSWERGDFERVLERFLPTLKTRDALLHWVRGVVTRSALRLGETEKAHQYFEEALIDGVLGIPRNIRWTRSIVEVAHACADLGDEVRATQILELLHPVADHHGVLPTPICYGGPVRYAIARLLQLQGHIGEAMDQYERALADAQRLGATPFEIRIQHDHGRLASKSGAASAAAELLKSAQQGAQHLGIALPG